MEQVTQPPNPQDITCPTIASPTCNRRYPSPARDVDYRPTSTPSKKLKEAQTTDQKLQVLVEAIERTNERLDEMEKNLKQKSIDTHQEQSKHIINEIKQALATQRFHTQSYVKDMFEVLSEELRERDGM